MILFAAFLATRTAIWEYDSKPEVGAIWAAWVASTLGILIFQTILTSLPAVRSARADLLKSLGLEPYSPLISGADACPLYRFIAGLYALITLFFAVELVRGKVKNPLPFPVEIVGAIFLVVFVYALGYLAVTGRWILGGNRLIGSQPRNTSR